MTEGEPPSPAAEWDDWFDEVRSRLQAAFGRSHLIETKLDDSGHIKWLDVMDDLEVVVMLAPGSATVKPPGHPPAPDDVIFGRMWNSVQLLASLRPSVVWEPDDDVIVDVSLPEGAARMTYQWV